MGDCCGEGVLETHEDDSFDQDGTQLRPIKRDASRPRMVTDDGSWPAPPDSGSGGAATPLARQVSLGVTVCAPAVPRQRHRRRAYRRRFFRVSAARSGLAVA